MLTNYKIIKGEKEICSAIKKGIQRGLSPLELTDRFAPFFRKKYCLGYTGTLVLVDELKERACKEAGLIAITKGL